MKNPNEKVKTELLYCWGGYGRGGGGVSRHTVKSLL